MALRQGSRGDAVRELQEDLVRLGSDIIPDGIFGFDTKRAVKEFQARFNLTQDGIVGPITEGAIRSVLVSGSSIPTTSAISTYKSKPLPAWVKVAGIGLLFFWGYTAYTGRRSRYGF